MIFRRTVSGIANMHLFHRVDIVAYCEGGEQLSAHDVAQGDGDSDTLDVFFWQTAFKIGSCGKRVHFKSVGNKATLLSIAMDVKTNKIATVLICLDRDHDFHSREELDFSFVLYSYGYSWENDVLSKSVLKALFRTFRNDNADSERLERLLFSEITKFESDIVRFCEYDIALAARKKPCLFFREKPLQSLDTSGGVPSVNRARLNANLTSLGYRRGPNRIVKLNASEVLRHVFGHLLARYVYHLFLSVLKNDIGRIKYETFMRLAISEFGNRGRAGELEECGRYIVTITTTALERRAAHRSSEVC